MFNRWQLNSAIYKVKTHKELSFDYTDLEKLINTLNRSDYEKYYELKVLKNDESEYECDVYFKFYDRSKKHLFKIKFIYGCNRYYIKYEYGINYHVDCLLLKWLCDLLTDKRYINDEGKLEKELREYEEV